MANNIRTHSGLAIYSRGFLGSISGELKSYNKALVYDSNLADKMYRQQQELLNQNAYSPNIVNLYSELTKNIYSQYDIVFLRGLILSTKEVFGVPSFVNWFLLQYDSPDVGSLHIDFLEDMLEYLLLGINYRPMYQLPIWLSVLNGIQVKSNETNPTQRTREMLAIYMDEYGSDIDGFINAMLLKENGVEQLVRTLYVLFGDTSAINHS